ncbi:MAG TPA: RDD family protein, partial [Acidimicrobiales bacterium]|nr:RDD family protein [Acidimicrobiales bacterium]
MPRRPLTDPTAVVARRGGAWFIDAVLCSLAGAVPALLLADAYVLNRAENGFDVERHGSDIAFFLRDTVVVLRRTELAITAGSFLVAVLILLVALPGRRGWSPGHLAADLRVVRGNGARIGLGRAFLRTMAWIVDLLPGVPLVAYVVARTTRRHQRVGDLLAKSY